MTWLDEVELNVPADMEQFLMVQEMAENRIASCYFRSGTGSVSLLNITAASQRSVLRHTEVFV